MDLYELDRTTGIVGSDLTEIEQSRHSGKGGVTQSGGSNHAFLDGNVRFLKYERGLNPYNL